jgi:hypothetical protein
MKSKLNRACAVLAGALLGGTVLGQEEAVDASVWNGWDSDLDNMISQEEWNEALGDKKIFASLDANSNGIYDVDEEVTGLPAHDYALDADGGGEVDQDELSVGWFDNYDADGDDMLNQAEFGEFRSSVQDSSLLN